MPKSRHSESLSWEEAVALFGEGRLTHGVNPRTVEDWKLDGKVPAYRIVQLVKSALVARAANSASALPMHSPLDRSILTAPERAMEDATFREAWKIVGQLWRRANPHKRKPKPEDVEAWKITYGLLRRMAPVGEPPDPAAEEPWPAVGHPLYR